MLIFRIVGGVNMDKEKLIMQMEKMINSYKEDVDNSYAKGAVIAMTGLLEMIKDGLFDIS
jgi:hypothetical protein